MFFMQFYGVKVGIQSPEGITTTRTVPRRFNDFLNLYSEVLQEFIIFLVSKHYHFLICHFFLQLKKEFPKKSLPPHPPKSLLKTRSKKVLVNVCSFFTSFSILFFINLWDLLHYILNWFKLLQRMCALEGWMTKLLSDIDVSRTAHVAIFLELEAAAREGIFLFLFKGQFHLIVIKFYICST